MAGASREKNNKLSKRQAAFVRAYLEFGSAEKAAQIAGYKAEYPESIISHSGKMQRAIQSGKVTEK